MIIHNLTKFRQNQMLSSLIVFTDKVTDTHTDRQTDKSDHNTLSHFIWRGKNSAKTETKRKNAD